MSSLTTKLAGDDNEHTSSWYNAEYKIASFVPLHRFLCWLVIVYMFAVGVSFIVPLCTPSLKALFSFCLIFCILYAHWAIWYDASYPVPPTYTFLKKEGYWTITALFCILNQVVLYGITTFVCIASFMFSIYYEDPGKVFDWDCLFEDDDDGWTRRTSIPTLNPTHAAPTL